MMRRNLTAPPFRSVATAAIIDTTTFPNRFGTAFQFGSIVTYPLAASLRISEPPVGGVASELQDE